MTYFGSPNPDNSVTQCHTFVLGFGMVSRNQIIETVRLQTGLHLYKTGQSKYWYVRILVPKTKKRISRSTQETSRIEAKKVAYEIYQDFICLLYTSDAADE